MTQSNLQLESERQISDSRQTCEYKIPALIILRHKDKTNTWHNGTLLHMAVAVPLSTNFGKNVCT